MRPKRIDSSRWTGALGKPAPLPFTLQHKWRRPLYTPAQNKSGMHALIFAFSPLLLLGATWLARSATPDLIVAAPDVLAPAGIACLAGFGLYALIERDILPRLFGWIGLAGWVVMILASILYVAAGLQAHRASVAGPVQRAQVTGVERHGRGFSARYTSALALADGSGLTVHGTLRGRNCYAVRRIQGSNGFAWLRIVEAAPEPGPGGLAWPIGREACFSGAPLSALRG